MDGPSNRPTAGSSPARAKESPVPYGGNNFVSDFNREDEMKLKPGMFVSCILRGQRVSKAYLGGSKFGSLVLYNDAYGWSNNGMEAPGYRYGWYFPPDDPGNEEITDIRVLGRKIEDGLEVGDIVVNISGTTRKVLAVLGDAVLLSSGDRHARAGAWWTVAELKERGDWLNSEPPTETDETTELTIDQIAEKFGLTPEQVRIKKEK